MTVVALADVCVWVLAWKQDLGAVALNGRVRFMWVPIIFLIGWVPLAMISSARWPASEVARPRRLLWAHGNDRDRPRWVCELSLHLEEFDVSTKALQVAHYRLLGPDGLRVRRRHRLHRRLGAVEVLWRFRRDGAPAPGALLLVALRVGATATSRASGLWAGVGGVVAPLLGLGVVGCVLWLVWHISFVYQWPYIEDWRRGTVRHENVACQNFHTELSTGKRSHREYVFDLVAEDGTEWNYRIRASAMKEKAEDEREPYASVYYTCTGEEDGLSIVLYEHTGIITEAWTNQAGQVH